MIIDRSTGEIISFSKDNKPLTPALNKIRSVDDMDDYMKYHVDMRKVKRCDNYYLRRLFETLLSSSILKDNVFKDIEPMTVKEYRILEKLGKMVRYRNIIMTTRRELCHLLGCRDNHLILTLKKVDPYVDINPTPNIRKGEIKILIHPYLFFTYEYRYYDMARNDAIDHWIMSSHKNIEILV